MSKNGCRRFNREAVRNAGLLVGGLGILAGCGFTPAPTLAVFYTTPTTHGETVWVGHYSARGRRRLAAPLPLGRLGLVAQTQVMSHHGPVLMVATGTALWRIDAQGMVKGEIPAPPHTAFLAVRWVGSRFEVVEENRPTGAVAAARVASGQAVSPEPLPQGLVGLWPSRDGPVATVLGPHSARWIQLDTGSISRVLRGVAPEGTAAFSGGIGWFPFAHGADQFGVAAVGRSHLKRYVGGVTDTALALADTHPMWAVTLQGMQRWVGGRLVGRLRPWPRPMPTTITLAGAGTPWLLVLGASAQGAWFNARTGRFGPSFRVQLPGAAIARYITQWP